ncbi:MAG: serine hydrolase [Rudaea sp.]
MQRILFALSLYTVFSIAAVAQDTGIFSDGFDPLYIAPLFPVVNGKFQLPPGSSTDQLEWLLGELASGETTTTQEVSAHFVSSFDPANMATFIGNLRTEFPNAHIRDVVGVTPYGATVVIQGDIAANPYGFVVLQTQYTGTKLFTYLYVSDYYGSVIYPADTTLTLEQAADKALTLAPGVSVLVAKIGNDGQCTAITQRNATTLRATGSIFKSWILLAMGRMIADGQLSETDIVPLSADKLAEGGQLNSEPADTPIPISDLSKFMMGNSDNTATDLMHARVTRDRINAAVDASGVADPNVLKPVLDISEQFHLFFSFPLATAQNYVNGSEAYQNQFLTDDIVPLGNYLGGGSYDNSSLLTSGSWRATPFDVCKAFSAMRHLPKGSEAIHTVDAAMGAEAAQPEVRGNWDRVWYKGGSLLSAADQYNVLTHAWMLENAGDDPYFLITMYNDDSGNIDQYAVQSVAGRMLQLLATEHP